MEEKLLEQPFQRLGGDGRNPTLSSIVSMNLFSDVAGRVKRSQGIWQINKHTGVVKNKLAVTFCTK